jgi:hypothetical protein
MGRTIIDSRLMNRTRAAVLTAVVLVLQGSSASGQEPTLAEVLERAGAYVTAFQRQLSGVVTEESYVQDVTEAAGFSLRSTRRSAVTHRVLKSDLLLVKPQGAERWIQFRDVFDVDGKAIRDRSERLMKLFVEPSASTAAQVKQIVDESVRYNIGNILRTINVPVFALLILERGHQEHFKFTRVDAGAPTIARDLAVPAGAWVIRYEEIGPNTLITTTNDRDLPSHGRFWIDPATGRVLMSELIAEDVALHGTIVVRYEADVLPDLLVPIAMRERYLERRSGARVDGAATYGRYRRFQVKVDEKIAPIKQ